MSTFAAPLRVYGDTKDGPSADVGNVTAMQEAVLTFAEANVSTDLFVLPANATVIQVYEDTTELFDAAATLDVGITGDSTYFVDGETVTTVGRIVASSNTAKVPNLSDVGTSAVTVTGTLTATAPTAGSVSIRCLYWVNKDLPT